ncbi:hypothetical protein ACFL5Z_17080 [Planctomycetota bacterium]
MRIRLARCHVVMLATPLLIVCTSLFFEPLVQAADPQTQLNPVGKFHIPIGIPNSLDSLKTFVEAEGIFSPGIGSYGIYFWVFDPVLNRLIAPTFKHVPCTHGLMEDRLLIPWSRWHAGPIVVRTEICEVKRKHPQGDVYLVGARAKLTNTSDQSRRVSLYVALRPLGPAGFDVRQLDVASKRDALLANGHTALLSCTRPSAAGVLGTDTIGDWAIRGEMPEAQTAISDKGDCSGALRFDLNISAGRTETVELVCPVLPGRCAIRHQWTPRSHNYIDSAVPHSKADGIDIPDAGLDYYRSISADDLFEQARDAWRRFYSRVGLELPDARWTNGFYVMLAHAGLCMNEGAADVTVLNYPVFNRDGMYIANMMQKAGLTRLSKAVIDYFLAHPFNGRPFPEADNPGQVLWSMGQHWSFTHDKAWLRRIYPSARKIAEMIRYYHTPPGPYWVGLNSLNFGDAVPREKRTELKPGRCDGVHPEYTEAFDIAGLRIAGDFAEVMGQAQKAQRWRQLADQLMTEYDRLFGKNLRKGYGSYSVLWPCRLYPVDKGKAQDQFSGIGKQELVTWRYFAPATAHQGLLAGNREAGYGTVDLHLDHPQMRSWFAFDEGGKSGSGGWHHLRTTWIHSKTEPDKNKAVAMPHGWALAEIWLLMRDCLVYEQNGRLVLLAGVSPDWFRDTKGITIKNLPTYFGKLDLRLKTTSQGAILELGSQIRPPGGFVLRLPSTLKAQPTVEGKSVTSDSSGNYFLPKDTTRVQLEFK